MFKNNAAYFYLEQRNNFYKIIFYWYYLFFYMKCNHCYWYIGIFFMDRSVAFLPHSFLISMETFTQNHLLNKFRIHNGFLFTFPSVSPASDTLLCVSHTYFIKDSVRGGSSVIVGALIDKQTGSDMMRFDLFLFSICLKLIFIFQLHSSPWWHLESSSRPSGGNTWKHLK